MIEKCCNVKRNKISMERKEDKHEENGTPDENEEKDNFYRNENNEMLIKRKR